MAGDGNQAALSRQIGILKPDSHRNKVCGVTQKLTQRLFRQRVTRRCQEDSVSTPQQIRASDLATQIAQLMAQDDDLQIPLVQAADWEQSKESAQYQVED